MLNLFDSVPSAPLEVSPTLRPPEEVRLKRTAMSTRELRRAEVLARVKSQTLRLVDAAKMMEVSYRQTKRLWKRYRGEGAKGLQHRSAGKRFEPREAREFRRKVLQLIREKYSGTGQKRFGPTLAAEHLADEDGLEVGEGTLRRWNAGGGVVEPHAETESPPEASGAEGALCRPGAGWMAVSRPGLRAGATQVSENMVDDATGTTSCQMENRKRSGQR